MKLLEKKLKELSEITWKVALNSAVIFSVIKLGIANLSWWYILVILLAPIILVPLMGIVINLGIKIWLKYGK